MKYEIELKINGISNIKILVTEEEACEINEFIKLFKED